MRRLRNTIVCVALLFVTTSCDMFAPPLEDRLEIDVELLNFPFFSENEIGANIFVRTKGDTVILLKVSENTGDSISVYELFHATYLEDGKEYPLTIEKRLTDEGRRQDLLSTGVLQSIREFDFVFPESPVRYKKILVADRPITANGLIRIELGVDAFDTGDPTDDLEILKTPFGRKINTKPYQDAQ